MQKDIESSEKFLFTLGWLLAVTKRHSGCLEFGLAHIDFTNSKILGDTYGAQKASQKLDEVSQVLRKAFRKTDLVARDGLDFWILVPYTPVTEKLADKVKYIVETASQGGLQIVERDISMFSLPQKIVDVDDDCTASEFLEHLKKYHIASARHEILLAHSE